MNKTQLREISSVNSNIIAKFGKNELVAMDSLLKISAALNADVIDTEDVK